MVGVFRLTVNHIVKLVANIAELRAEDFEVGKERVIYFVEFQYS